MDDQELEPLEAEIEVTAGGTQLGSGQSVSEPEE